MLRSLFSEEPGVNRFAQRFADLRSFAAENPLTVENNRERFGANLKKACFGLPTPGLGPGGGGNFREWSTPGLQLCSLVKADSRGKTAQPPGLAGPRGGGAAPPPPLTCFTGFRSRIMASLMSLLTRRHVDRITLIFGIRAFILKPPPQLFRCNVLATNPD